jgi:hypothetical protein
VKFRYCGCCKKPVTKQNFRSRHLHADILKEAKAVDAAIVDKEPGRKRKAGGVEDQEKGVIRKEHKWRAPPDGENGLIPSAEDCGDVTSIFSRSKEVAAAAQPRPSVAARFIMSLEATTNGMSLGENPVDSSSMRSRRSSSEEQIGSSCKRKRRWLSLLSERPHGLEGDIGVWLSQVLDVSAAHKSDDSQHVINVEVGDNFHKVVGGREEASPMTSARLDAWKALLEERPDACVGSNATEWIVKVLKVSCRDYT